VLSECWPFLGRHAYGHGEYGGWQFSQAVKLIKAFPIKKKKGRQKIEKKKRRKAKEVSWHAYSEEFDGTVRFRLD
jgi:hypothetical protein